MGSVTVSSGARLPQQLLEQRAAVGRGQVPRVALVHFHLQLAGRPARVPDAHPEVTPLRDAGGHELLGAVQVRVRDALDDARREPVGQGALERVQAVDLEVALDGVGAGEEEAEAEGPQQCGLSIETVTSGPAREQGGHGVDVHGVEPISLSVEVQR